MIEVKRLDDDTTALICPDLATADRLIAPHIDKLSDYLQLERLDKAWKRAGYRYED
jgi:hypothetical protein